MKYTEYDGIGLAELIKRKEVSPEELIASSFQQLDNVNMMTNGVVRTRKEKALEEAKHLNLQKPFAGVPIVLKDLSQGIKGELATCGARLLKDYTATKDSHFTSKLREAGFSIIGQTNTPEFGFKNITDPVLFGETKNPWNTHYSAGGSSGGAAASVASGIVPIAGASDGGGSIRIPASFTSLFGLKPTRGRTPVGPGVGRQWQGAAIDFVLSRSVRDSAALLDVLQVIQPEAAFQVPLYEGSYLEMVQKPSKRKFKIAFSTDSPVGTPVSEEAKLAVHRVVRWLEEQGHIVEEKGNQVDGVSLIESYYIMNGGETAAMFMNMEKNLGRPITKKDVELMTWVIYTVGKSITAAEYSNSLAKWDIAATQMARLHDEYDFYLTPTTAFPAPKNGELVQGPEDVERLMNVENLSSKEQQKLVYDMFEKSLTFTPFTQLANLTGQPSMSVPVHLTKEKLPLGVQFTAPKGKEDWLFMMGSQLEQSDLWIGMKENPMLNL